jgi:hypothetical protein
LGADDAPDERGLPAARRPEQAGDTPASYPHREVVQRWMFAANHPQMADVDRCFVTVQR